MSAAKPATEMHTTVTHPLGEKAQNTTAVETKHNTGITAPLDIVNTTFVAKEQIAESHVLMETSKLVLHPRHVTINGCNIEHSLNANTVLVEGFLVAGCNIPAGEVLTVNICYFVYDMTKQFPDSFAEDCKGFKYLDEAVKQKKLYLCEPPVRVDAMNDGWIVVSTNSSLTVRPNGDMGQTAYATEDIPAGTKLFHATGLMVPWPTMYTICVGEKKHLLFGDAAECIAHHCDPNVRVVVRDDETFEFVTVKDIVKGAMVTFCYNTTEWEMTGTFPCLCGSDKCMKDIRGFKHVSDEHRQRLWNITSDHVKSHC